MAASAERCSTLIWRGLGGMASRKRIACTAATLAAMRFRPGSWIALAALVATLALAPGAAAQQAPTLGAPAPPQTIQTQVTTATSGGGLKTWQEALIVAAGIILIGGIAVAILTDARERAGRLGHGGAATEPAAGSGHRHRQQSKQRARAKGKAARAQRRRNR